MREYIYGVILISAAIGIISILSPEGGGQGLKKHIRLISSVCLLCVLIEPASKLIDELFSMGKELSESISQGENEVLDQYEKIYEDYFEGKYGDNVGQAVKEALYDKFSIKNENCRVATEFSYSENDGVKTPRKITVVLSGQAVYVDPLTVTEFISELFGCESEVDLE